MRVFGAVGPGAHPATIALGEGRVGAALVATSISMTSEIEP